MAFLQELIGTRDVPSVATGLMLAALGTALITATSVASLSAVTAAANTTPTTASAAGVAGAAGVTGVTNTANAANAATTTDDHYEAVVCSSNRDHVMANIGGWNQYGRYVHTPNFRLRHRCGYQPGWWFRRDQMLEVNVRTAVYGDWSRRFVRFDRCRIHGSKRVCRIP